MAACSSAPLLDEDDESRTIGLLEEERRCRRQRKVKADEALRRFIGQDEQLDERSLMPTIGIACSGGGTRAMLSTLGMLDGLSEVGLLDGITYLSCLSGSTWAVSSWLSSHWQSRKNRSKKFQHPVHGDCSDPWMYGGRVKDGEYHYGGISDPFGPDIHTTSGVASVVGDRGGFLDYYQQQMKGLLAAGEEDPKVEDWCALLQNGEFPIPLYTAITTNDATQFRNQWSWVEISPFEASVLPHGGLDDGAVESGRLALASVDHLMAICGSAFAFHWGHSDVGWLGKLQRDPSKSLLTSLTGVETRYTVNFTSSTSFRTREMTLIDAGIDFNVPLPPLLSMPRPPTNTEDGLTGRNPGETSRRVKRTRNVDIVIVLDASKDAIGPKELQIASEQGYYQCSASGKAPLKEFPSDGSPIVIRPKVSGDPVLIYLPGLTHANTGKFQYSKQEATALIDTVRTRIIASQSQLRATITSVARQLNANIRIPFENPHILMSDEQREVRAMMKAKYQVQFDRIYLLDKGEHLPNDDFADLYMRVRVEEWHHSDDQLRPSNIFRNVEDMWRDGVMQNNVHRISLEGPAGSGKSTLCQYVCRQQYWPELFTVVLYVGLPDFAQQQPQEAGNIDLTSVIQFVCQQLQMTKGESDRVMSLLSQEEARPLFIFDGYDEVESRVNERSALGRFLNKLMNNTLDEQCSCMLVSRFEKKKAVRQSIRMVPEPWRQEDVSEYIDKFFGSVRARSLSVEDVDARRRAARYLLLERTELESSPLVCELVCSIARAGDDGGSTLKLHQVYSRFEGLLWARWADRRRIAEADEVIRQRKAILDEVSFRIFVSSGFDGEANERIHTNLADTGFFLLNPVNQTFRFSHKTICEHAAARHLYTTRLRQESRQQAGIQAITSLEMNLQDQKMFLIFLGLMLQDDNQQIDKEMWLMKAMSSKYKALYATHHRALDREMEAHGNDNSVREHWAKMIGLNALVEVVSVLDSTGRLSTWFLDTIKPGWAFLKAIGPAGLVASATPWVYHLILDLAAHHGNQAIVLRLCRVLAGKPEYLHHPMIAAYASRRGVFTREILLSNGAAPVDLSMSIRYGHAQAAIQRLALEQLSARELREACEVLFSSDPQLVTRLAPGLLGQHRIMPAARLILQWIQSNPPTTIPPEVREIDIIHLGSKASADSRRMAEQVLNTKLAGETNLFLQDSSIVDADCMFIADVLKINSTLTTLHLSLNQIGDAGCTSIGEALKVNSTLTELRLSYNQIGSAGCTLIGEALRINATLAVLHLCSNQIGDAGCALIGEALKTSARLSVLHLSGNRIGNAGCTVLGDALKINRTITVLLLSDNQIGDSGCAAFGDALKINSTLTTLDLRNNRVRDVRSIGDALKTNSALTSLDLYGNQIIDTGCSLIADALKINSTLTTLDLSHNQIRDAGCTALSDALKANSTLITLELSNNQISDRVHTSLTDRRVRASQAGWH